MRLPDQLYDFFARDSRDGERRGPFDTKHQALAARDEWRTSLELWIRCCIHVTKRLSKAKIARALRAH